MYGLFVNQFPSKPVEPTASLLWTSKAAGTVMGLQSWAFPLALTNILITLFDLISLLYAHQVFKTS